MELRNEGKRIYKKYHLIAYLIMIILIFTVGMAVKWYRYNEFAGRGPAIGYAYKYFNLILGYILVAATILFIFLL